MAVGGTGANYRLDLRPEDILRFLLTLQPEMITKALRELRKEKECGDEEEFEFADIIPKIHQHLSCGSIFEPKKV